MAKWLVEMADWDDEFKGDSFTFSSKKEAIAHVERDMGKIERSERDKDVYVFVGETELDPDAGDLVCRITRVGA